MPRLFTQSWIRDTNLHNAKRLILHQLVARVCFSWTYTRAAFESLCKQSSRAATRVTRKMRALRTIEPYFTLSQGAILSLLLDGKKREDRLLADPPRPDACHEPRTEIIANNSTTNGSNTTIWCRVWGDFRVGPLIFASIDDGLCSHLQRLFFFYKDYWNSWDLF